MLSDEVKLIPELKAIHGEMYILELLSKTPSTANIASYVEMVKEYARRRQFKAILQYLDDHADEEGGGVILRPWCSRHVLR